MRLLQTNYCSEAATTITASTTNSAFPTSNLKNYLRSKRWRSSTGSITNQTLVFDFQTIQDVNSVVLLWPKEDGIRLTGAATIKIQANATNVWTSPSVDQTLTINDDYSVASHFFTTNQSYRYWRIVISDATNPWDYIELGVAWIGLSLSVENAQNGFVWDNIDLSKSVKNDFGHKYTDEYPISTSLEISYQFLEYGSIQVLENAFKQNGTRKPIIVVVDPTEEVFDKDHFLIYGTMSNGFGLNHQNYNLLNTKAIKVEELS